jgi:hypothetical protein
MRKKKLKKGKAHVKGVQYIAKQLKHYQKGKYPSYTKALPDARIIYGKLKENKQHVTLKNIWGYSRKAGKKRGSKKAVPYIPQDLLDDHNYWETLDFASQFKKTSDKIFFESTISPSTLPKIQGGTSIDAEEYFKDFVRFCNALRRENAPEEDSSTDEWQVRCTEPTPINGKWISTIICTDSNGDVTNYGFDPDKPSALPKQPYPIEKKKEKEAEIETEIEKPTQTEGERAKEIRLTIEGYNQLLREKLINKKEWLELVTELNKKFAKGGKL